MRGATLALPSFLKGAPFTVLKDFGETAVMPVQFEPARDHSPEAKLAFAVFESAWNDLFGLNYIEHMLARKWITATDTAWPLSFTSICDHFGWDAPSVRRRILSHPFPLFDLRREARQNYRKLTTRRVRYAITSR